MENKLFYNKPAENFIEALPVGSGKIGAMIYGKIDEEIIELNADTLWSGKKYKFKGNKKIDKNYVKNLILSNKHREAEIYIKENVLGDWSQAYLPAGKIIIKNLNKLNVKNYKRTLDIKNAVHTCSYKNFNSKFTIESFTHLKDDVFIQKYHSDTNNLNFDIKLSHSLKHKIKTSNNSIILTANAPINVSPDYYETDTPITYGKGGIKHIVLSSFIIKSGTINVKNNIISIRNCNEFIMYTSIETNFYNKNYIEIAQSKIENIINCEYSEIKKQHINEYKKYYKRVKFKLDFKDYSNIPTDVRLKSFKENNDFNLFSLLFNYGRYLTISSSKKGSEATNLQGIWNNQIRAPWSSNYTVNINTQMNYWHVENCNLSEFHYPLFSLIDKTVKTGKETAKKIYGIKGSVAHHNLDIWGHSTPVGRYGQDYNPTQYGMWNMSLAWLSRHYIEHYLYNNDINFLKKYVYQNLKEIVTFILEYIDVQDDSIIVCPSTSPENTFLNGSSITFNSTIDLCIIKEVLKNYIYVCKILKTNDCLDSINSIINKINPIKIGKYNQIQEYYIDYDEDDVNHRHISHLYGVYPSNIIENKYYENVKNSLNKREDDGTGWCIAWKACVWARLKDGNRALKLLKRQLQFCKETTISKNGGTYPNLLCAHPPFQIDGNFGFCAAIVEMLMQSNEEELYLLPALCDEFKSGYIKGLKSKGNFIVDIEWNNNKLTKCKIKSKTKNNLYVIYNNKKINVNFKDNLVELNYESFK
ncbi:MAG: glycoside hydrolase family 95 protein [Erysipelotrichaceae bacterium]|nr:glycoside hydrolase family 95 protein [Erysipelotrichaceae bacterium]